MAQVTYTGTTEAAGIRGKLFHNIRFWVSQKVPQRSRFIDDIKSNGGEVYPLEKQASVLIVDHARKEALPGTHSYTFIERSVRTGVLEDLADHAVGPREGAVRSVGSVVQPPKGTRKKYTAEDDRILWDWVNKNPQKGGGTDGNEIYKQLETKHPQHPWQSWRDRFIKFLKGRPAPYALPHNAPPTPPLDVYTADDQHKEQRASSEAHGNRAQPFTEDDAQTLMEVGEDIMNIHPESTAEAWETWVKAHDRDGHRSAKDWQHFWKDTVRPRYLMQRAFQAQGTLESTSGMVSTNHSPTKLSTRTATPPVSAVDHKNRPEPPSESPKRPKLPTRDSNGLVAKESTVSPSQKKQKGSNTTDVDSLSAVKRKFAEIQEELPSSSPPQAAMSPKRIRQSDVMPREIASTPQRSPTQRSRREDSPLFIHEEKTGEEGSEDDGEDEEDLLGSYESKGEGPFAFREPSATLPELDRSYKNTQAFFREPTPFIDFDVPPPDEGWGSQDSRKEPGLAIESDDTSITEELHGPNSPGPDTQAILQSKTQIPDFDLPAPDLDWMSPMPSSPPQMPDSQEQAESVASSGDLGARIDAWIDSFVVKGVPSEVAEEVLKCTNLETALAEKVLESLRKGKRKSRGEDSNDIPTDWRGVWTAADDKDLYSTDARKIGRLEEKHGKESLQARWEFLDFYNDE